MAQNDPDEQELLRSVALQNAAAILQARQRAEQELVRAKERAENLAAELQTALRRARLGAEVAGALAGNDPGPDQLRVCVESMVRHLDAAFVRIWTLNAEGDVLELQASAGLYTHTNGPHARIPVGAFKIGLIAKERRPHLTNDLENDPRVSDKSWAARAGLTGFAGYPLLVRGRVVGVVAMFSRLTIAKETLDALASVADVIALSIERQRAEASRAETETRKASILEAAMDCIIVIDGSGLIFDFNPAAERQLQRTRESVLGKELAALVLPAALLEKHREELREYVASGKGEFVNKRTEVTALRADGSEFPVEMTITPMVLRGPAAFTVNLRDITERRAEAERRELLAELAPALATLLDARKTLSSLAGLVVPRLADWCAVVIVTDDPRRQELVAVAHVDPTKAALAEELANRYPAPADARTGAPNVIRTGRSELYADVSDDLLVAGATDAEHLRIVRELHVRSAMIVPLLARGRTLGAMTFVFAESGRRYTTDDLPFAEELARRAALALDNAQLYESEQTARRNADVANRAKDDFLATVSHELRTPLNSMLGWTKLLRTGELSKEKQERALETIERNAMTQAQLIEDLLDVSRIISGKLQLDMQSVELGRIAEHAIEALRLAAGTKGVTVLPTLDDDAGPVTGDAGRLQQVVWNLLSNAIKFTPQGGRIHLSVKRVASSLRLVVADSGRGIAPVFLPQVFERFKQEDGTATRARGGLGLGLAISRHIVELHGGTIEVQSKGEGHGTTFTVVLPIMPVRQRTSAGTAPGARVGTFEGRPQLKGLRVLVVDDEADARDLLVEVLTRCGAIVTSAGSVAEAMDGIARSKPDLLLSDIGMSGDDGYTLMRRVRALPHDAGGSMPAAALTAYARVEDRRKALDAGFTTHIPKPVEPSELIGVIVNLTRFVVRR